jgi:hypothetical protein
VPQARRRMRMRRGMRRAGGRAESSAFAVTALSGSLCGIDACCVIRPLLTVGFFALGFLVRDGKYGASPVPLLTVGFLSRPDFVAHRHETERAESTAEATPEAMTAYFLESRPILMHSLSKYFNNKRYHVRIRRGPAVREALVRFGPHGSAVETKCTRLPFSCQCTG